MKISPSSLGLFIGITFLLSPCAWGSFPDMPSYDGNIAKGQPAYSKTSESDGAGGYVQKTYFTDSNGVRTLIELQKYNKDRAGVRVRIFHWVSVTGPNGSTINMTETYANPENTFTKEEIDKGGGKTVYHWDGHHWKWISYTKAESSGVHNSLQGLGGLGLDVGGVHLGHGGHEHVGDHVSAEHKSPDKKHAVTDKHHTDDRP